MTDHRSRKQHRVATVATVATILQTHMNIYRKYSGSGRTILYFSHMKSIPVVTWLVGLRPPSFATSRPRWGYVGLYRRRWDCSSTFAPAPDTRPAWGLIQKLPQREKPPHAERHSHEGCALFPIPPLRVHVATVAEQQPALVDEVSDGGDVAGTVHDGQL